MKKRIINYHFIVDESESMIDCDESVINAINEQINKIKSLQIKFKEDEITIGLTTFNNIIVHRFFYLNPSEISLITINTYEPSGSTALLDAIGTTIDIFENQVKRKDENIIIKVKLVILTDGNDNASKLYSLEDIKLKVSNIEKITDWEFIFIGATLDLGINKVTN